MGTGVADHPRAWARRLAAAAALMLVAASLGGCGFAEVFCGNAAGTCEAEIVDVRTAAVPAADAGIPGV